MCILKFQLEELYFKNGFLLMNFIIGRMVVWGDFDHLSSDVFNFWKMNNMLARSNCGIYAAKVISHLRPFSNIIKIILLIVAGKSN